MIGVFSGAVLAGGSSSRFGADKAMASLNGRPLWQRQREVLVRAGASETIVIRNPDQPPIPEAPVRLDRWRRVGPMAGLHAALAETQDDWVAVLAVDMPGIDAEWFKSLAKHCSAGVGAISRHAHAWEPLAAIYPREALPEVERHLKAGRTSLQMLASALAEAGVVTPIVLTEEQAAKAQSVNTRALLGAWEKIGG